MPRGLFADVSQYQDTKVDWQAYKQWSQAGDGISRLSIRASYGVGYRDPNYAGFRAGAENADVNVLIHYHYAYPEYVSALHSAAWHANVVGKIAPQDIIMLDYEERTPAATAQWAYDWLAQMSRMYSNTVVIYSYPNFIEQYLQDERLTQWELIPSIYTYDSKASPACPLPWKKYFAFQYSDKEVVPGITSPCDANVIITDEEPKVTPNTYQLQQMKDTWNMLIDVPDNTGIYKAWASQYTLQLFGAPLCLEKDSVSWNGDPIKVQLFSGGIRCEWNVKTGGPAIFYDSKGNALYRGY